MKQRAVLVLVLAGLVLAGVAIWQYQKNNRDYEIAESICSMGGQVCNVEMNWTPTLLAGILAIAAFVAAWLVNRSGETERSEDLVS